MLVRNRMTPDVRTVTPETTLAQALSVARTHGIRHLPVVQNDRLVGLVTDRDLRLAMPPVWADTESELQAALHERTVSEVMQSRIFTTYPDLPVETAARLLYENRIGCLPVMDEGRLVGILTETDLLRALVELFGGGEPSSRLEVHMPNKPGELARVVRVIGIEHRINITGLVLPPSDTAGMSVAIMHLQTINAGPLAAALRKLGYETIERGSEFEQGDDVVKTGSWSVGTLPISTS
jgi:acetoin utilization protein AcuB